MAGAQRRPVTDTYSLPEEAHVGATALAVESLDAVTPFYRDALGFDVERDGDTARLLAGDLCLLLMETPDSPARSPTQAGLFHVAVRVPDRGALADALVRLRAEGAELTGASDHLVSEALYLRDPAGNGIELYRDRPRAEWPEADDGTVEMDTLPLDLDSLAAEGSHTKRLPAGTGVGHVHLEVTDLARSERFYAETLGMNVRARYGSEATFLAAGDYHHHVGLNTWNGRTEPAGESRGLAWFELVVPDAATQATLRERLDDVREIDDGLATSDPDGIELRIRVEN